MQKLNKNTEYSAVIEKIVPEGKSLTHIEGMAVFLWGGLPGETVSFRITKNKKTYAEGVVTQILEPSEERIAPCEDHYLVCSPWQVLPYPKQIGYKEQLLREAFRDRANENVQIARFYESEQKYGYRTKLEFSFTENDGKIALAFHKRGFNNEYEIVDGCALGSEKMSQAAQIIEGKLNTFANIQAKGLKSLTIRQSKSTGQIIAILLYKFKEYEIDLTLSNLNGLVDGLIIGYSTIKSPISVITEIKYQEGIEELGEKVLGKTIRYPYDGFFQNNLPVFEKALNEIQKAVPKKVEKITELYCGSGSIGLNLTDKAHKVTGIEIVPSAVKYAKINEKLNKISNYNAIELADHKISAELLEKSDVLILDPPRSGLHPRTLKIIMETLPETIIYLSCNPITQARDLNELKSHYKIEKLFGFDFYPNTVHMESLLILSKL